VVGAESRIKLIAKDLIEHFEARLSVMDGKAMVVTMSRRIAVALYNEIVALRPEWQNDEDARGSLKVVMTGSASDPLDWQPHIRTAKF
jgi:type I restriction enzyme, R subunit